MNGIKEVAKAYYERRTKAEKELVQKFFHTIDANGDGKVSREELFQSKLDSGFSNQEMFDKLDSNEDGMLDFDEVLALYYMVEVSIPKCSSCHHLLTDSYFSCLPCQGKSSYCLCCNCYSGEKFNHKHPSTEFLDTRAMLKLLDQLMKKADVSNQTDCEVVENDTEDRQNLFTKFKNYFRSQKVVQSDNEDKDGENKFKKTQSKLNEAAGALEAINSGIAIGSAIISIGSGVAVATSCSIM